MPSTTAAANNAASSLPVRPKLARFHSACMPGASRNNIGSIGTRNIAANQGAPTEILPRFSASRNTGYRVPSRIKAVAATSSTLFNNMNDSRDTGAKPASDLNRGARHA